MEGATSCKQCSACPERRVAKEACEASTDTVCVPCCLIAAWSLNGDTTDDSLNAYNLSNSGLTFVHGTESDPGGFSHFNMSMYAHFDSSGLDFARVGPGFDMRMGPASNQQLTIEMWLRTTDDLYTAFHYNVIGANDLSMMGAQTGNSESRCILYVDSTGYFGPPSELCHQIRDNQWHHFALTLQDGFFTFFVDGSNMGSTDKLKKPLQFGNSGMFVLGQDADNRGQNGLYDADQAFVGDMADFRMWNVSKNQTEILDLMHVRFPHVFCEAGWAGAMQAWGAGCVKCPVGTYKKANGTDICQTCPAFSHTNLTSGQTHCKCIAGFGMDQEKAADRTVLDECVACAAGKYKAHLGSEACSACIPHSHSPVQSDEVLDCICNKGYEGNGSSVCLACPVGKYKDWEGPRVEPLPCASCPKFSTTATTATTNLLDCLCLPGYTGPYGPPEAIETRFFFDFECSVCEQGFYKASTGSEPCLECPQNATTAAPAASSCACNAGYTGRSHDNCTACVSGKFKDNIGSEACLPCAPGSYAAEIGASACMQCPAGAQSSVGSALLADCVCKPGYSGPDGGPCRACEQGKYKEEAGSGQCLDCPAHTISSEASTLRSLCLCQPGFTYNPSSQECEACEAGTWKAANGSAACSLCPLNTNSPQAAPSISACVCNLGYTGPGGLGCSACAAGTYKVRRVICGILTPEGAHRGREQGREVDRASNVRQREASH